MRLVPSKPVVLSFFDLMSFPGKLRAGFEALGLFRSSPTPGCEESVEEFVGRNLDDKVFKCLIESFYSVGRGYPNEFQHFAEPVDNLEAAFVLPLFKCDKFDSGCYRFEVVVAIGVADSGATEGIEDLR